MEFQEKYNRVITSSSPHLQDRDECHAEAMQSRHLPFQYMCSVLQHPTCKNIYQCEPAARST